MPVVAPRRPANDPAQYDDLAGEWWKPRGMFAALHWLAAARAELIPPAPHAGAVLVDVACGGGLLAPHVRGYRHVGVDIGEQATRIAREHGVQTVRGSVYALPLPDECAEVVVAGEIFEHVTDLPAVVAEVARILKPGGTLVCDTIADTRWARFSLVTVGEHFPGGPPPGIHDPALFVNADRLQEICAGSGITLQVRGLRPSARDIPLWLLGRRSGVRMLPIKALNGVYQGVGVKQ